MSSDITDFPKPKLGVSSCIIGNKVRYDGGAKSNHWLIDVLGEFVEFRPLCPEMAAGMSSPREAIQLVQSPQGVRALGRRSKTDYTSALDTTSQELVRQSCRQLDGYVLMQKSPSCGLERVKVYDVNQVPNASGQGRFAIQLAAALPFLPLIESGRLSDPVQREHFVLRLFTFARFHRTPRSSVDLQTFHRRHKLLLLAYNQEHYRKLGQIASGSDHTDLDERFDRYQEILAETLATNFSLNSMTNALMHIYGFVKSKMAEDQRHAILDAIEQYKQGLVPLLVPLSLIKFAARLEPGEYLAEQIIFTPYPAELRVRSAV